MILQMRSGSPLSSPGGGPGALLTLDLAGLKLFQGIVRKIADRM
jgi:hypothetical protein